MEYVAGEVVTNSEARKRAEERHTPENCPADDDTFCEGCGTYWPPGFTKLVLREED